MDYKTLFAKTPPFRLFLRAAIPGCIGMLASALYQLFDGILVGQILQETAFAALNFAMPIVIINFSISDLVGVGSSVPISIKLGEKNEKDANNIFTCACIIIVAAGTVLGSLLFALAPMIMHLMGADGELADLAAQYLRVYAVCSPFTTIVFAVDNYLRICGKINTSMFLNIFMSLATGLIELLFLGVFHFGIWGAALATCTGMAICTVIAFYPFFRGKMQLKFQKPKFSANIIKQIIACGSPNFLSNSAARIISIAMNMILLEIGGETAVSVYGILMFADGFVQPILYGMCDSLQPAIGFNYGAKDYGRVGAVARCCFSSAALLSLLSAAFIFVFPREIVHLFMANADSELIAMAIPALKLFSLTYLTRWLSFAGQSFMAAIEKPVQAAVISLAFSLVLPAVAIAVLWNMGLKGLWLNMPFASFFSAVLALVILLRFVTSFKKLGD